MMIITDVFIKVKSFSTAVSASKFCLYSMPLILYETTPSFVFASIGAEILSLREMVGFGIVSFKFTKAVISFSTIKFKFLVSFVALEISIF